MKTFNGKDLSVRKAFSRVFTVINLIAGEVALQQSSRPLETYHTNMKII